MIRVIQAGQEYTYPTVKAVAFACDGMTSYELWSLEIIDITKNRRVSWVTIEAAIRKLERLKR